MAQRILTGTGCPSCRDDDPERCPHLWHDTPNRADPDAPDVPSTSRLELAVLTMLTVLAVATILMWTV